MLSFTMIFSIILIIAVVAVAGYVMVSFLNVGTCGTVGIFYDDFQKSIDSALQSDIVRDKFNGKLPRGIEAVCFRTEGAVAVTDTRFDSIKDNLKGTLLHEGNIFLYPAEKACDSAAGTINSVDLSKLGGFYCFSVEDGRVSIPMEKGSFDRLVSIVPNNE